MVPDLPHENSEHRRRRECGTIRVAPRPSPAATRNLPADCDERGRWYFGAADFADGKIGARLAGFGWRSISRLRQTPMAVRRAHPSVAPHPGFVLLSGGQGNGQFALASAELFDPASNAFAAASSMKDAREDHTATVLPSGKILVAGGEGASGGALSSAELYDPISGKFSAVAAKMGTRARRAYRDADFRMQLPGRRQSADRGRSRRRHARRHSKSAELYDPATGKFTATGAMKATRARHSATLIASGPLAGNVLIAGGTSDESGGDVATAELYDPTTGQFALTGRMSTPRENHSATFLSPSVVSGSLAGNVLVAGGGDVSAPSDSAEVFNPQTAAFSPVGAMTTGAHAASRGVAGQRQSSDRRRSEQRYGFSAERRACSIPHTLLLPPPARCKTSTPARRRQCSRTATR